MSTRRKKDGPKSRVLDDKMCQDLLDAKLEEQFTWEEVAELYKELSGGDTMDWRTIRKIIMKDAPQYFIPKRVSGQVRRAIEDAWEGVDVVQLIMYALNARFTEWSLLNERKMKALIDGSEGPSQFSLMDQDRFDKLWNDLMSFFFRATEAMRDLNPAQSPIINILNGTPGSVSVTSGKAEESEMVVIEQLVQRVGKDTEEAMATIMDQHRAQGIGMSRTIPDMEEDLLEENA